MKVSDDFFFGKKKFFFSQPQNVSGGTKSSKNRARIQIKRYKLNERGLQTSARYPQLVIEPGVNNLVAWCTSSLRC